MTPLLNSITRDSIGHRFERMNARVPLGELLHSNFPALFLQKVGIRWGRRQLRRSRDIIGTWRLLDFRLDLHGLRDTTRLRLCLRGFAGDKVESGILSRSL